MLIKNARIFTMKDKIIENGFIFVQDGKIESVGDMEKLNFTCDEVLDLCSMDIYPGFIDAHTHLGIFENGLTFEGDDGNEESDPLTPNLRAIDAVNPFDKCFSEALKSGVTSVLTSPGSANPIGGELIAMKTYGHRVDNMIIKSPAGIKFALGENPKFVYRDKDQAPTTRMATAALIREQLYKATFYLKNKKDTTESIEYDAKCEALIPALKREIKAYFHVHRADDIFTAIRISKEFNLDYVLVHATDAYLIIDDLKKENAKILTGPILCDRSKPELLNLNTKAPGALSKSGILTAMVTDHPETPIHYLNICCALAVRDGMSKEEALKAITINPAKICNIDNKVGSIEKGKDADFVVFNQDPFDIYAKPEMVIYGGKILNLK